MLVVEMVLYIRLDACHGLFYLSLACLLTSGLIWKCLLGFQRGFTHLFISQPPKADLMLGRQWQPLH